MAVEIKDTLSWKLFISNKDYAASSPTEYEIENLMYNCGNWDITPFLEFLPNKSNEMSTKFRKEGNVVYSKSTTAEQLFQANGLYNKSIAYASNRGQDMAISYANKTAVLFRLEKYRECLKAMKKCFKNRYPIPMQPKVRIRKIQCLAILNRKKAYAEYVAAVNFIEKKAPESERESLIQQLDHCYQAGLKTNIVDNGARAPEKQIGLALKDFNIKQTNPSIECASSAIDLEYNKTYGRHLVATRDIQAGEIIAIDHPFVRVLNTGSIYTHCWRCFKVAWDVHFCDHCSNVVFCSDGCKNKAWDQFHNIECTILHRLIQITSSDCVFGIIMALRATIKALESTVQNAKFECQEVNECTDMKKKGFAKCGQFENKRFRSFYSLCDSFESMEDKVLAKYIQFLILFVTYTIVTETKILRKKVDVKWNKMYQNEDVVFVAKLMYKNFGICNTNCFKAKDPYNIDGGYIAPFLSFLNHSCSPNVSVTTKLSKCFSYAIIPIKKGEQIFYKYTEDFLNKNTRQDLLEIKYNFTCTCVACREDWPLENEFPSFLEMPLNSIVKKGIMQKMHEVKPLVDEAASKDIDKTNQIQKVHHILRSLSDTLQQLFQCHIRMPCREVESLKNAIICLYETLYA